MSWRDHLARPDTRLVAPWLGGRGLRERERSWRLRGALPAEHGWHSFRLIGREAEAAGDAEPDPAALRGVVVGYLVGDRVVPDGARIDPDPLAIARQAEAVRLIPAGLDRFARVSAGRFWTGGPLVYRAAEFPLGPEADVAMAYEDRAASVAGIAGVTPALDAAFRMESWARAEADRRRAEAERQAREEAERRAREERRAEMARALGDGAGRREMARVDFRAAARAALAVGGAEHLDDRAGYGRGEHVVRFRVDGRRFECVCDDTLRVVDAGICLQDHETGRRDDSLLTLESLPSVIREAIAEDALVVLRH